MNGKLVETGFRDESGYYQQKFYPSPLSEESKEISINRVNENIELARKNKSELIGTCGCCDVNFAIPSEVANISNTGCCCWCSLVLSGKAEYHVLHRNPTLQELINQWRKSNIITQVEQSVAMEFIHANYAKIQDSPYNNNGNES